MGISLTTISTIVEFLIPTIYLVDRTVDAIDKIIRRRREWSKKDEDNEYNKFKRENREKNGKNQKLNSNYRQYNKRPEYRYDYYNDDYDYDLKEKNEYK
jgi:hypothetical protein